MQRALSVLGRLAETDAPVLLLGETGTGKDVFARALHGASRRAAGPLVALNCTAVPASLFEAELFGHRRGAFTGAVRDRVGLAEQASGGTLFLDEIGELALDLQPKLLRLLQERRVMPVGATQEIPVDIRVIAATNRDLRAEVTAGRFREDLYYRLSVVEIELPPLRERLSDLPELCRHLLERHGHAGHEVTAPALRVLTSYDWPGNVRELENEVVRAAVLAADDPIEPRHLSTRLTQRLRRSTVPDRAYLTERLESVEREVLREVLRHTGGNRTKAAAVLGLTRQGLQAKLRRLGMDSGKRG
jgi:two-component system response regulator HydG